MNAQLRLTAHVRITIATQLLLAALATRARMDPWRQSGRDRAHEHQEAMDLHGHFYASPSASATDALIWRLTFREHS